MDDIPVIRMRSVTRVFRTGSSRTHAIDGISFDVHPGEFVGVVGTSGSGKSTLLNILGLLDTATSGSYELNGTDVASVRERDRNRLRNGTLGFVFQESHTLSDETAAENAALPLKIRGVSLQARAATARRELVRLGLSHRASETARNLSGGERQRVAIARAVSTQPDLILADEPTGALDSANSARVIEQLRALNRSGTTVVLITHDRDIAAQADRQVELRDGRIVADSGRDSVAQPRSSAEQHVSRVGAPRASWISRVTAEVADAVSAHTTSVGRTLLLLLAFALGIGGLVAATGISQSAATQVSQRFTAAGLDEVIVQSSNAAFDLRAFDTSNPEAQANPLLDLPGIRGAAYVASAQNADARPRLLRDDAAAGFSGQILVTTPAYLSIERASTAPEHAAGLLQNDWEGASAILGTEAAAEIGIGDAEPGVSFWIGNTRVDVVGFVEPSDRDPLLAQSILLSDAAAAGLSLENPRLVIRTDPGAPAAIAEAAPLALSPADPTSITVQTVADLRNLRGDVGNDLAVLVMTVSGLLLLLACVTSAVSMFLTVRARAAEVALRRAVGASRISIWRLFTFEGLIIGAGGGLVGTSLGMWAIIAVSAAQSWSPILQPGAIVTGLLLGTAAGVLSAAIPAAVAARSNPAQAIRA